MWGPSGFLDSDGIIGRHTHAVLRLVFLHRLASQKRTFHVLNYTGHFMCY
jgi:hypothetical protein